MSCDFASSYEQARALFLDAAAAAGAEVDALVAPVAGPDGEDLAVDVASVGDSACNTVLFVCSGTHGVEGFAGSAIQNGLLKAAAQGLVRGSGVRLVLIHGLNPFGFAWLRRATEDNIDLNRNFVVEGTPFPANEGYAALADILEPTSLSAASEASALLRLLWFAARHGIGAARDAVTRGQYDHPQGLFYGGHVRSWSARALEDTLSRHGRSAERVVFLDVHTGLGPYGKGEVIVNSALTAPDYGRAKAIWGERVKSTKASESVSADLFGTLKLAVPGMMPGAEVTAASIEFGTYPAVRMLRALRAENWLHHFGDPRSAEGVRIKAALHAAFVPDDPKWRASVCRQGLEAADLALAWLRGRA